MTSLPSNRPHRLIKDAAKHSELVVFVGAGASRLCGSPDWQGFASQVVNTLERARALNFIGAEQLRRIGDPRRTLSIAMAIAKEREISIDFDNILHPGAQKAAGRELYELLASLRPVFVTTNYDKWLEHAHPQPTLAAETSTEASDPIKAPHARPVYYLREHLTPDRLAERGAVIHLHGSYLEPSSMIVSLRDYIEHYADEQVRALLSEMFRNYTVLFVGYGLAELEILDQIVRANEVTSGHELKEARHFILYPNRSSEDVQTAFIERFFKEQCGVQVIRYCIDDSGYGALVDVFRAWVPELDVRDPTLLDLQARLDRWILDGASATKRDSAIRLVRNQPKLTAYLINALKDPVWFDDLEAAGFFETQHSPGITVVEDEAGALLQAEGWPALRYLERITPYVTTNQAKRIAAILRAVAADAAERGLENWRTSWSLAIILSQLPLDVIGQDDIELARTWLLGRFQANAFGPALGTLLRRLLDSPERVNWNKALSLVGVLSTMRPEEQQ